MRYSLLARLLHWLMALGFVFMWLCGYVMTTWAGEDTPLEEFFFDLHISIGVTLAALLAFRIAVRLTHRPPAPARRYRHAGAPRRPLGHAALYVCWRSRKSTRIRSYRQLGVVEGRSA